MSPNGKTRTDQQAVGFPTTTRVGDGHGPVAAFSPPQNQPPSCHLQFARNIQFSRNVQFARNIKFARIIQFASVRGCKPLSLVVARRPRQDFDALRADGSAGPGRQGAGGASLLRAAPEHDGPQAPQGCGDRRHRAQARLQQHGQRLLQVPPCPNFDIVACVLSVPVFSWLSRLENDRWSLHFSKRQATVGLPKQRSKSLSSVRATDFSCRFPPPRVLSSGCPVTTVLKGNGMPPIG